MLFAPHKTTFFHVIREKKILILISNCSELVREKMWSRIHLIPLLQAEEDRDQARRYFADKAREKELLGTDSRVYNSNRYVTPPSSQFGHLVCQAPGFRRSQSPEAKLILRSRFVRPTFMYTPSHAA